MFAHYLFCDDVRRPPPSQDPLAGITVSPSLEEIENAIRSLDGDKVRLIIVAEAPPHEESYFPFEGQGMMIGGGGDNGLYVCQVGGMDGDTVYFLTAPENKGLGCQGVMFGQLSHFDGEFCVDLARVIQAAREFSDSGILDEAWNWKK